MGKNISRTKIVATIGPACSSEEVLAKLILEGVDVFRVNFSHGTYDQHLEVINRIKKVNQTLNTNVAILADLQGPKIRVGEVENNGIDLIAGEEIVFTTTKCMGTKRGLYISYQTFPQDVQVGEYILLDDGKLRMEVTETNRIDNVKARVLNGGILSSKKGVNLPNTKISLPSLTEKDRADAEFAIAQDVDWLALSFVRSATDIVDLHELIKKHKKHTWIIAKIEKPEALIEIDNIIDMTHGIMIARGDLGVETPFDKVPLVQKDIIKRCQLAGKPVIVATQMMESMITNFRPTRAEANDVANAVIDGADALMLSGETSVGKYPVETIQSMQRIISYTEENAYKFNSSEAPKEFTPKFLADSICYNATLMAKQTNAKAIVTFTHSGHTAFKISGYRPKANVFVFTANKELVNKLSLFWGVQAFYYEGSEQIDEAINNTLLKLKEKQEIKEDDIVVHVGSMPMNKRGQTNMLKVTYL
ncbi:MAG TPA: pyruvate kinase [Bacteroidales bacterium]|nr:MAG: pyruvate kinase [Bacteroidetes bacterium GWF2_33_38]OFY76668.1 MAG: pyruvate kinase [Bacteroidetes bacterium RIFOXYA12_FULL_33_9]OFY86772.1 MAG: pyruvate kinase [Bacteroidetes bacterium RIFOXYA2_FULL_33_7]HBF88300.1 pyruvate kinase [Bacteroidales bacterium]